jgi:enoyl-CoA hydratase/3-hydroxyacyl-CoA dehydrogenase
VLLGLQVLLDTLELSTQIKKTPVVVGNCTGFAVNRVFFPYTMAACILLDSGINPFTVRTVLSGGSPGGESAMSQA